jgi:hypothetical protein
MRVVAPAADTGSGPTLTCAASTQYTYSAWVYSQTGGQFYLQLSDGIDQGLAGPTVTVPAGVWTRLVATGTTDTHTGRTAYIFAKQACTFWVDGVQVEAGPYATPYKHTDGATATRPGALITAPIDDNFTVEQGWIAMRVRPGWPGGAGAGPHRFFSWRTGSDNGIELYFDDSAGGTIVGNTLTAPGPVVSAVPVPYGSSYAARIEHTLVFAWTSNNLRLSLDGAAFVSTIRHAVPIIALSDFTLGRFSYAGVQWADSEILWFAAGRGQLSDGDVDILHDFGNSGPFSTHQIPGDATFYWSADSAVAETDFWTQQEFPETGTGMTPFQPTLPEEGQFTEAELTFIEEEPPGLFPDNQDSNFGWIIRHHFSNFIQDLADDQLTIYNERFVETSVAFLDQWEKEVGLPPNPIGVDIALRRQAVMGRLQRGPFTRPRRNEIIERYIQATFGNPILLVPEGVALVAGGTPLYSESGIVGVLYNVVEDQQNYHYSVNISVATDPNLAAMAYELERITPAGITFDIIRGSILTYGERQILYPTYQDVFDAGKTYETE